MASPINPLLCHDHPVTRSIASSLLAIFTAFLLCMGLPAQTVTKPATSPRNPAYGVHAATIEAAQKRQQQALISGDSSLIAETSREFAKELLYRLAEIERSLGHVQAANEITVKANALKKDDSLTSLEASDSRGSGRPKPQTRADQATAQAKEQPLRTLLAQAFGDLGTAEARQGQFPEAKAHFEEALVWGPATPDLLRSLGTVAYRVGDFITAVKSLHQYFQSADQPSDPRTQLIYALSLFSSGNFAAAATAFKAVETPTMQDPRAAYAWAFSLARSGEPQRANEIADKLTRESLPPEAMSLVCHIFFDTESYQQGLSCYRSLLSSDPAFRLAHYQAAEALIRMDRPEEAISELREELRLNPDDPNVQYALAFALLQTSKKEEASHLLENITAAHPEMAQPQYQYGKLLIEAADLPKAIEHLELAERADPSLDYVHYQLQAAYRKMGRSLDADREAKIYKELKASHRDLPASR